MYEGEFSDDWTLSGKVSNGPRLNPQKMFNVQHPEYPVLLKKCHKKNVCIMFKRVPLT